MTVPCQILDVPIRANITAIDMIITKKSCTEPCNCVEPCDVDISITWKNTGGVPGTFEPAIKINTVRTGSGSNKNLGVNETYTETFNVINLIEGNYNICPDPN